jgi:hypothetical protein
MCIPCAGGNQLIQTVNLGIGTIVATALGFLTGPCD